MFQILHRYSSQSSESRLSRKLTMFTARKNRRKNYIQWICKSDSQKKFELIIFLNKLLIKITYFKFYMRRPWITCISCTFWSMSWALSLVPLTGCKRRSTSPDVSIIGYERKCSIRPTRSSNCSPLPTSYLLCWKEIKLNQ